MEFLDYWQFDAKKKSAKMQLNVLPQIASFRLKPLWMKYIR